MPVSCSLRRTGETSSSPEHRSVRVHLLAFIYRTQLLFFFFFPFLINVYKRDVRALGSSAVLGKVLQKTLVRIQLPDGRFGAEGPVSGCAQPFSGSS